jgi:hypothetical protein
MKRKGSIFESVGFLVIVGILAGAVGGLAIGVVTGRTPTTTTSTAK